MNTNARLSLQLTDISAPGVVVMDTHDKILLNALSVYRILDLLTTGCWCSRRRRIGRA